MISLLFFVVLLQVLYGKSTVLSETLEPVEAVAEMTDNISQLDLLVLFLFIIGVILLLASVARKERNGSSNPVKILTEESESALKRNTATDATIFCERCGTKVENAANSYCENCGAVLPNRTRT